MHVMPMLLSRAAQARAGGRGVPSIAWAGRGLAFSREGRWRSCRRLRNLGLLHGLSALPTRLSEARPRPRFLPRWRSRKTLAPRRSGYAECSAQIAIEARMTSSAAGIDGRPCGRHDECNDRAAPGGRRPRAGARSNAGGTSRECTRSSTSPSGDRRDRCGDGHPQATMLASSRPQALVRLLPERLRAQLGENKRRRGAAVCAPELASAAVTRALAPRRGTPGARHSGRGGHGPREAGPGAFPWPRQGAWGGR